MSSQAGILPFRQPSVRVIDSDANTTEEQSTLNYSFLLQSESVAFMAVLINRLRQSVDRSDAAEVG